MKRATDKNRVIVFDTTLRDGEQAPGFHLAPEQKLEMAFQLRHLGVDVIEAGFPVSSPAEFRAVSRIAETVGQGAGAPDIAALARSVKPDIEAAWNAIKAARRPRLHTFLAASDIHLEQKLHMTRSQAIARAVEGVRFAKSLTPNVQFSPEDASRSDRRFLAEVVRAVIQAGATTINIPDTVGYTVPFEFAELIATLRENVPELDTVTLSVHCHDDLGLAVANSLAAIKAGARQVECTINGIGERAGNCALEEVVMVLQTREEIFKMKTHIRSRELTATSQMLARLTGAAVAPNKAIVGENAFAHASGVHQDGMLKDGRTYEIMRPEEVGAGESRLLLTARSGRRALEERLRKLGVVVGGERLPILFDRFKEIADTKKIVTDEDLLQIV